MVVGHIRVDLVEQTECQTEFIGFCAFGTEIREGIDIGGFDQTADDRGGHGAGGQTGE